MAENKAKIGKNEFKNLNELSNKALSLWYQITPEECTSLISSMPRHVQTVFNSNGGTTKY